jgi:hypothetical protein
MPAQLKRLLVAVALAAAPLTFLAAPGRAAAEERQRLPLRKGVFEGVWHTDPVTIIIEKVNADGSFSGELHFDPQGRWGDVRCGLTGVQTGNGGLVMTRSDCPQTARTGRPEPRGGAIVWKGDVTGPDFTSTFELRVPVGR